MELDIVTQAILTYAPAIVSIITMICTVIVSIKKVASSSQASVNEVKGMRKENDALRADIGALIQENAELKDELHECLDRMNNIYHVDVNNGKKR